MKLEECKGCDYLIFYDGQWLCQDEDIVTHEPQYCEISCIPSCGDWYCQKEDKSKIHKMN